MKSVQQFAATAAAVVAFASRGIDAKAIYAHYMVHSFPLKVLIASTY